MWTLHEGQIVEVAAECEFLFRPAIEANHGRNARTIPKAFDALKNDCAIPDALPARTGLASVPSTVAIGKCLPHCRQSVFLAAAYSICLKPQCGHSTLTLAGDLATDVPCWN
jgi:hypothetical protein